MVMFVFAFMIAFLASAQQAEVLVTFRFEHMAAFPTSLVVPSTALGGLP